MSRTVNVSWDGADKTCIIVTYPEYWNWDEFDQAGDSAEALLGEVTHTVDIIHLMTETIPTNTLTHIPDIARTSPTLINPQIEYAVVVGASRYLEIAYRMFRNIYPDLTARLFMAESLDDAHALIAEKRAEASV